GTASVSLPFKVYSDGADVTSRAAFAVDDARLGAFDVATFRTAPGAVGRTVVRAAVGMETATTSLTLRIEKIVIVPGAPPDAPDPRAGATPRAPRPPPPRPPARSSRPT